jgi:hypothetical protein
MRDRLIALLQDTFNYTKGVCIDFDEAVEINADHLLANGVIVPPCKVGDIVYSINRKALGGHWEDNRYIVDGWGEYKVCEIPFSLTLWECGWKGIFLTREEAEAKLKGGEG